MTASGEPELAGRIAVVTGSAQGQGAATARLFAAEGARVVIADIVKDKGRALAEELGPAAMYVRLDVTDEANWEHLAETVATAWGQADILINNAGILLVSALNDVVKADFERVIDVNLLGPWLGTKVLSKGMIECGKGSIVNVCSTAAPWGMHGTGAYLASKWALRGLSKSSAMELGWRGVRVNAIFPGGINTPFANVANKTSEELKKDYLGQPIQRIGEPEEIAQANLFLASDRSSYLCGAEIAVDGGQALGVYRDFLPGGPDSQ